MKLTLKFGLLAVTLLFLAGCSNFQQLLKGNDYEAKYKAAVKYYGENNYSKALQLLESLTTQYHGKEHADSISWLYAMSLLKEKDYVMAGYQFKAHFKRFPYNPEAEEALYMSAFCKYQESPDYWLDQTQTKEAIQEFESYLDRYPASLHVPEINSYLDQLRGKLMRKDYDIAYNYYLTGNHHAAYVTLQAFLNNYPEAPQREDAMFYLVASSFEYGINSTPEHQRERLQQVVDDFDRFAASFRNSPRMPLAQDYYTKAKAALASLQAEPAK